jgi:hypothetical protein
MSRQHGRIPVEIEAGGYRIAPAGQGWSITVMQLGVVIDHIAAATLGEAMRRARLLSDDGLIGWVEHG